MHHRHDEYKYIAIRMFENINAENAHVFDKRRIAF